MGSTAKRFFWVSVYATAMALLEAVVVAYLRALIQVTADHVELSQYAVLEVSREVGTIAMLVAVGCLAGRAKVDRWAYGLFAFGLWDIFYYVWLKVFLDWPSTLLDLDLLFLIPVRWWGPVLSPVLVAALLCVCTVLAVQRWERGDRLQTTPGRAIAALSGSLLALYVFMADALNALLAGQPDWNTVRPGPFRWPLFLVALALMGWSGLAMTWPEQATQLDNRRSACKSR